MVLTTLTDLPTISNIADYSIPEGDTKTITFLVTDVETSPNSLVVARATSNSALVPINNVELSGSSSNRTITLTPTPTKTGTSTITLSVADDSGASVSTSFVVTVNKTNGTKRRITFIHTDLLGSPIAETNEFGEQVK